LIALVVVIALVVGAIVVPCIAQAKGYGGGEISGWFFCGLFLWPAALIHVLITEGRETRREKPSVVAAEPVAPASNARNIAHVSERARKEQGGAGEGGSRE